MSEDSNPYGRCPICGSPVAARERRPDGNDRCEEGHVYPSRLSLTEATGDSAAKGRMPVNPTPEQFRRYVVAEIDDALTHSWVVTGDRRRLLQGMRDFVREATDDEVRKFMAKMT